MRVGLQRPGTPEAAQHDECVATGCVAQLDKEAPACPGHVVKPSLAFLFLPAPGQVAALRERRQQLRTRH